MLGAVSAELVGLGFGAVEIDDHRIFIRRIVAIEPHQDEAYPVRLERQKFLALGGREIDHLGMGGRGGHDQDHGKNRAKEIHGQYPPRKEVGRHPRRYLCTRHPVKIIRQAR